MKLPEDADLTSVTAGLTDGILRVRIARRPPVDETMNVEVL